VFHQRHFPPEFVQAVKDRLGEDIVGIISRSVSLTKRGNLYVGLCPNHNDTAPSLNVRNGKSGWHYWCNVCQQSFTGDVFRWLEEREGLKFPAAVASVAEGLGMELPAVTPQQKERQDRLARLHAIVDLASKWMANQLYHPCGADALSYLEKRGIGDAEVRDFRLGYAPGDRRAWQGLITQMTVDHRYRPADLIASGVFRHDPNADPDGPPRPVPFFFNRLIFTICNPQGRPIAFAGRMVGKGDGPKYINTSAECELYDKGRVVYNAHRAAARLKETDDPLVACEGYLDVIAADRAGWPAVCCGGTAISSAQIEIMWRLNRRGGPNVPVICLDGDPGGLTGTESAARLLLPLMTPDRSARFARLENKDDPDSLLRRPGGETAFRRVVEEARTAPWVVFDALKRKAQEARAEGLGEAEAKALLSSLIDTEILKRLQDPHLRQSYRDEFWQARRARRKGAETPAKALPPLPRRMAEPALLAALLNHPDLFSEFCEEIGMADYENARMARLRDRVITGLSNDLGILTVADEARYLREDDDIADHVLTEAVFSAAPFVLPETLLETVRQGVRDILVTMRIGSIQKEVDSLMDMLTGTNHEHDQETVSRISALLAGLRGD
jgi:DNA primase